MSTGESTRIERARIVEIAREYLGTRFHHQGREKGVGIDCVGLPICVAERLEIKDRHGVPILRTDHLSYSPEPGSRLVHDICVRRLDQKAAGAALEDGDVLTMRVPTLPCHAAIVAFHGLDPYIIHAYSAGPEKCVEHILNEAWSRRIIGKFRFPGVSD
jgi:hypothetical protein